MKTYVNFELDIVLIENVDVITASPFTGETDDFENPNSDFEA
jgi:hypothetical protein